MRQRNTEHLENSMTQLIHTTWDAGWEEGYEAGVQSGRDDELGCGSYAADVLDIVGHLVRSDHPGAFHDLLRKRYTKYESPRDGGGEVE